MPPFFRKCPPNAPFFTENSPKMPPQVKNHLRALVAHCFQLGFRRNQDLTGTGTGTGRPEPKPEPEPELKKAGTRNRNRNPKKAGTSGHRNRNRNFWNPSLGGEFFKEKIIFKRKRIKIYYKNKIKAKWIESQNKCKMNVHLKFTNDDEEIIELLHVHNSTVNDLVYKFPQESRKLFLIPLNSVVLLNIDGQFFGDLATFLYSSNII
jgi:hypothetical protein